MGKKNKENGSANIVPSEYLNWHEINSVKMEMLWSESHNVCFSLVFILKHKLYAVIPLNITEFVASLATRKMYSEPCCVCIFPKVILQRVVGLSHWHFPSGTDVSQMTRVEDDTAEGHQKCFFFFWPVFDLFNFVLWLLSQKQCALSLDKVHGDEQ